METFLLMAERKIRVAKVSDSGSGIFWSVSPQNTDIKHKSCLRNWDREMQEVSGVRHEPDYTRGGRCDLHNPNRGHVTAPCQVHSSSCLSSKGLPVF